MNDTRLITPPPLPKGAIPRPLSCQGPGNHSGEGYLCANYGIEGCLGYVCTTCARKQLPPKAYCEQCNVCELATKNGCSMTKALAIIAESNPAALKRGTAECASTKPGAPPCRHCIRKKCNHCEQSFRSHSNRSPYCGDLCKAAAQRETNRQRQERHRQQTLVAA